MKHSTASITLAIMCLLLGATESFANITITLPDNPAIPAYTSELLQERISNLTNDEVIVGHQRAANISLRIDKSLGSKLGSEGYRIKAAKDKATITAADGVGLLYGSVGFIEWIISRTTPGLIGKSDIDIDFPVTRGQAAKFIRNMPKANIEDKPYYPIRGAELTNLALGVGDLINTPKGVEKYNDYSKIKGGYDGSAELWKNWCDWLARHKMNFVTNWPYSAGTNWWEMAVDPATTGMSIYDSEEITKAAKVREELMEYARSRGLKPYMMNYIAGAPTLTIAKNHPEMIGKKTAAHYPDAFCLSSPQTTEIFIKQIKASMHTYPSMSGLHLRWWGESFPCGCDKCKNNGNKLKEDLTLAVINAASGERPDVNIILSGFFRTGGTKEFAHRLPQNVVIQSKWGNDWEPTSDPAIPFGKISSLNHPFLISQALPAEEYHSIGGVHYTPLKNGVMKYVNAEKQVPNLSGFATVIGEKDHEWITETNYIAMAKLNWDPTGSSIEGLIKNYLATNYGPQAVEPTYQALELFQKAWETYCVDYAGVATFADCARTHGSFGLARSRALGPSELQKRLPEITQYANDTMAAVNLLKRVEDRIAPQGKESFRDLMIQTQWFAEFFASRQLMTEAMIAEKTGRIDEMAVKLRKMRRIDQRLFRLAWNKPNISDDFEMEGMTRPIHIPGPVSSECKQIDELISPEALERYRKTREIFATASAFDVIGNVGTKVTASIALPADLDLASVESAHLLFSLRDLDGDKPGDEAVVRFPGTEFKAPPTGDSQTKSFELPVDMKLIKKNRVDVQFELAGKPGGTGGYSAAGCRLILTLK